jgi:error-prone DNA polymerase
LSSSGSTGRGARTHRFALRLGLRQIKGLKQAEMEQLVARRGHGYADLADVRRRAGVSAAALDRLARADAFQSLTLGRRGAIWSAIGLDRTGHEQDLPPLFAWAEGRTARPEARIDLPEMRLGEEVLEDYANLRLTLRAHPLALLRGFFPPRVIKAERLVAMENGRRVEVAGLTLVRQRPGTASGVIFITIEDESGIANLVVWPSMFERFRRVVLGAQLMVVRGKVQKEGLVIHVVAEHMEDRSDLLRRLGEVNEPFESPVARADRLKPGRGSRASGSRHRRSRHPLVEPDPPLQAPLAHADHAKSSGPPDPRDPFFRPRDLDHFRSHPHIYRGAFARPDESGPDRPDRGALDPKAKGFKSRDFH